MKLTWEKKQGFLQKLPKCPLLQQYGRKAGILAKKSLILATFLRLGKLEVLKAAPEADCLLSSRELFVVEMGHAIF